MKLYELYFYLIKNNQKKNVSDFDIRYLISFFQKKDFYFNLNDDVKNVAKIKKRFKLLLNSNIPLAYLINETVFLGNKYFVNRNVLIPRVETEELVLLSIKNIELFFNKKVGNSKKKIRILDVGTGSGVIAIELKKRFPFFEVVATDISKKILKVAKKNAQRNKVDVIFEYADVFPKNKNYNVIISNPPYIKYKKDVQKSVLKYEPHMSLFISKENNVYEKIFRNLNQIKNLSLIIFEIADNIIPMIDKLMNQFLLNKTYNFVYSSDINKKKRFLSLFFFE